MDIDVYRPSLPRSVEIKHLHVTLLREQTFRRSIPRNDHPTLCLEKAFLDRSIKYMTKTVLTVCFDLNAGRSIHASCGGVPHLFCGGAKNTGARLFSHRKDRRGTSNEHSKIALALHLGLTLVRTVTSNRGCYTDSSVQMNDAGLLLWDRVKFWTGRFLCLLTVRGLRNLLREGNGFMRDPRYRGVDVVLLAVVNKWEDRREDCAHFE